MPTTVFALLVLSGAALYFMNAEERARLTQSIVAAFGRRCARQPPVIRHANRSRSSCAHAPAGWSSRRSSPASTSLVFALMVMDPAPIDQAETLIAWGGSVATRTAAGEWWRLVSATFVHGGVLHLAVTICGLVPLGLVLERAVGRIAFASIYLGAGVLASIVSLWTASPTSVHVGASGAVLGVYGLLLASLAWAIAGRLQVPIPLTTVKSSRRRRCRSCSTASSRDISARTSALAGLGTGFIGGLVIARGVAREKPPARRAAMVMAATTILAAGGAFMFERVIDFRPEIAGIVAVEERTAAVYDDAAAKFRSGRLPAKALVQVIDRTIVPDLRAVRARVLALRGVPREQAPLAAAAEEYFRLREQSWRDRARGCSSPGWTCSGKRRKLR